MIWFWISCVMYLSLIITAMRMGQTFAIAWLIWPIIAVLGCFVPEEWLPSKW